MNLPEKDKVAIEKQNFRDWCADMSYFKGRAGIPEECYKDGKFLGIGGNHG